MKDTLPTGTGGDHLQEMVEVSSDNRISSSSDHGIVSSSSDDGKASSSSDDGKVSGSSDDCKPNSSSSNDGGKSSENESDEGNIARTTKLGQLMVIEPEISTSRKVVYRDFSVVPTKSKDSAFSMLDYQVASKEPRRQSH